MTIAVLNLEIQTLHTLLQREDGYVIEWTELWLGLPQAHQLTVCSFECREVLFDRWIFLPVWFQSVSPSVNLSVCPSVCLSVCLFVCLFVGRLVSRLVGGLVGRLVGRSVGWSVGQSVGWVC